MKTVFLAYTIKNSSVAEFFTEIANQLSSNYNVIIFTHSVEKNFLNLDPKIDVLNWPSKRPTKLKDFIFLARSITKNRPEIMISNFAAVNVFLIVGNIFRIKHRLAWYHTLTTQLQNKPFLRFRKKFVYKMATKILANSISSKNDLIQNFCISPRKIEVVHNAVKNPGIQNKPVPSKIVFAGRLEDIKGVDILIKSMSIVVNKDPGLKLVIIGGDLNSERGKSYRNLVGDLGLDSNIEFLGNTSKEKVLNEFSSAYVTVVPSKSEAFGYVVIESLSVGTPVIASDNSGISEIITNGKEGFLFKNMDYNDLASKILRLTSDKTLRDNMSRSSYETFQKKFELESSASNFINKILK